MVCDPKSHRGRMIHSEIRRQPEAPSQDQTSLPLEFAQFLGSIDHAAGTRSPGSSWRSDLKAIGPASIESMTSEAAGQAPIPSTGTAATSERASDFQGFRRCIGRSSGRPWSSRQIGHVLPVRTARGVVASATRGHLDREPLGTPMRSRTAARMTSIRLRARGVFRPEARRGGGPIHLEGSRDGLLQPTLGHRDNHVSTRVLEAMIAETNCDRPAPPARRAGGAGTGAGRSRECPRPGGSATPCRPRGTGDRSGSGERWATRKRAEGSSRPFARPDPSP